MALTTQYKDELDFDVMFTATDTGRQNFIDEQLKDYVIQTTLEKSRFIKAISKGKEKDTFEPGQVVQKPFLRVFNGTMTDSGGGVGTLVIDEIGGVSATVDLMKQYLKYNQIVEKVKADGTVCQAQVTTEPASLTSTTVAIKAYGGTTLETDTASTEYNIGTNPWFAKRDFEQPTDLAREMEHTFTQKFMREVQMDIDEEIIRDKVRDDDSLMKRVTLNLDHMALEIGWSVINGRPQYVNDVPVSMYKSVQGDPTMAGIRWWAEQAFASHADTQIYVDCGNQPLTDVMIRAAIHRARMQLQCDYDTGNWKIFFHPTTKQYVNDWLNPWRRLDDRADIVGFSTRGLDYNGHEFLWDEDIQWPELCVGVVNCSDIQHGFMKRGTLQRKEVYGGSNLYRQWQMWEHRWGIMPEKSLQIIWLYNVRRFGT